MSFCAQHKGAPGLDKLTWDAHLVTTGDVESRKQEGGRPEEGDMVPT